MSGIDAGLRAALTSRVLVGHGGLAVSDGVHVAHTVVLATEHCCSSDGGEQALASLQRLVAVEGAVSGVEADCCFLVSLDNGSGGNGGSFLLSL